MIVTTLQYHSNLANCRGSTLSGWIVSIVCISRGVLFLHRSIFNQESCAFLLSFVLRPKDTGTFGNRQVVVVLIVEGFGKYMRVLEFEMLSCDVLVSDIGAMCSLAWA